MRTSTTFSALLLLAGLLLAVSPAASQQDATSFGTASTATADEQATAARTARTEQLRRFRYGNLAEIELSGKKVTVSYADLATDSDDYRAFEALEAGEVSAWQSAKAIKLMAHVSLSFGDVAVPYGNHSPNYPGVYSLWPKRTADGWSLIFNSEGDIWGTQRDPAADAAEVPLEHSRADEPTEKLTVEFLDVEPGAKALPKEAAGEKALPKEAAGAKVLRIAWGDHQFLAALEAAP